MNHPKFAGANFPVASPMALLTMVHFMRAGGDEPTFMRIDEFVIRVFFPFGDRFLIFNYTKSEVMNDLGNPAAALLFRSEDPKAAAEDLAKQIGSCEMRYQLAERRSVIDTHMNRFEPHMPFEMYAVRSQAFNAGLTATGYVALFANPTEPPVPFDEDEFHLAIERFDEEEWQLMQKLPGQE